MHTIRVPRKALPLKPSRVPLIPREISWLSFNERVLQEADNERNPLLERIKFLGIFSNNLDEFYRVRVASLQRFEREDGAKARIAGMSVRELVKEIRARVLRQAEQFNQISQHLFAELENQGVFILDEHHLDPDQADQVREFFQSKVRPRLVPIICHPKRELPALRDQFIYLAVELTVASRTSPIYAFIEVPTDSLSRFFILPRTGGSDHVVLLEDVIRQGLPEIFSHFEPTQCRAWTVKITRDSELDLDDDLGEAYVERVHRGLRKRRIGAPVRMVYDKGLPGPFLKLLVHKMKLGRGDALLPGQRYHNFKDFMKFPTLGREHLTLRPAPPIPHPSFRQYPSAFDAVAHEDVLLHFPYHGFVAFVDFLREAAIDPRVTDIRMTVYRVSHTSSVLNALINAARNGKQVVVVIEILARFDEENNLDWVDKLRDEGVEVITGVRGLKVHAKLLLVSRRESKRTVRYAAIGTGNFNEETARLYADHCLLTSDPYITTDVLRVFEFFRNNYKAIVCSRLVVSPYQSRKHWRRLIRQEVRHARSGRDAYIWIKLNNFDDVKLIRALYAASRAGVRVRLIVRSVCALVPQLPGISANVRAVSLVGRYLEHSRFLVFGNGGEPLVYITSGDWMKRNFEARVEVACPILDPSLAGQLIDYFTLQWEDTANARLWDGELSNTRPSTDTTRNSHDQIRTYLQSLTEERN